MFTCSVGWGCGIHRLNLCRGVRPPDNECSRYDTKQAPVMLELWGMRSIPSLPSLPGSHWPRMVTPDRVLSIGQIELNCVLTLNSIAWNRTVLTLKLRSSCKLRIEAKLNYLKWKYFYMLNWIVWNGAVFIIETVFTLNWIDWNRTVLTFNCV